MDKTAMMASGIELVSQRLETCTFQEFLEVCKALSISIEDLANHEQNRKDCRP